MSKYKLQIAAVIAISVAVWYVHRSPKPTGRHRPPAPPPRAEWAKLAVQSKPGTRYQGRTAAEWGQILVDANRDQAASACQALHILGSEGRPYLVKGLDNSRTETRRMCLETLSVSDLRTLGEDGRQRLVKLSGDSTDLRIRERAWYYLSQWNRAIPSP